MDDEIFERFTIALLSRELYRGLNPTSRAHDLGEDARTEPTTLFLHNGLWISLASSKEYGWGKIKADCNRCKETGRKIDVFVFVTAGNPRTDTIERWKTDIKTTFGWALEVHTIDFIAQYASRPQFESLVDDYLFIPPPGEDYIQDIESQFSRHTKQYLGQITNTIPGMDKPIPRDEVSTIEEQLSEGRCIVLSGEAGTGKSGIAAALTTNAIRLGIAALFVDARNLGSIITEGELRNYYCLHGPLHQAISRIGRYKGCRVIIDQLDNIVGFQAVGLILNVLKECLQDPKGVNLVVVCRNKEQHEQKLLRDLLSIGFSEKICSEISDNEVKNILTNIKVSKYTTEVIELGRNLLNLELIGQIRRQQPDFDFSIMLDEIYLWEEYIRVWGIHEGVLIGEEMLREASNLAKVGLNHPDGFFEVISPASVALQRLISWEVIMPVEGRIYRFRHEKFQDFIYARNAADLLFMPKDILNEILEFKSRNVFAWTEAIYAHRKSAKRLEFLQEVFNV